MWTALFRVIHLDQMETMSTQNRDQEGFAAQILFPCSVNYGSFIDSYSCGRDMQGKDFRIEGFGRLDRNLRASKLNFKP